jgi:hypothetical protein
MSKLKDFVENKKGYELKCKVAQEMADNASKGFADYVYNMTKDAKPEEVSELIESGELNNDDKLAIFACYADTHKGDSELELYGITSMLMLEKRHNMEN